MNASIRIAHISDPHFGTTTEEKKKALVTILHQMKPSLVAFSGDITQRARKEQFLEAKEFCKRLAPLEVIAVPGNHDIPLFNLPARLLKPYAGFEKIFGFSLNSFWSHQGVEFIALNTTHRKRHVQGELYQNRVKTLNQYSKESLFRIAMFHHPLDCRRAHDEKNLLISGSATVHKLVENQVDLVLSGHIHDHVAKLSSDRYANTRRPFVISVAATCLSSRIREDVPNSFNLIEIEMQKENVRLHINRYDLNSSYQFTQVQRTTFFREGRHAWSRLDPLSQSVDLV